MNYRYTVYACKTIYHDINDRGISIVKFDITLRDINGRGMLEFELFTNITRV